MRRAIPAVSILALVFLCVPAALVRAQSTSTSAANTKRKEKDKPKDDKAAKEKPAPKVFTNDDLEATSTRPSKVQDATARGVEAYEPPRQADAPSEPPSPPPPPPGMSEYEIRLKAAEDSVKGLEDLANSLLWQYLQSGDTNEILRLKAEQQGVLEQLEQAKAELARIRAEGGAGPAPAPTPPPG